MLIILTAFLGIVCLSLFVSTRTNRLSNEPHTMTLPFGAIQLLTSELGELTACPSGIIAGNSNGEIQVFTSLKANTTGKIYKLSNNPISAPVLEHHNVYYVGDEQGIFYAFDPQSGIKWTYQTGNKIMGGAIYANGKILVGSYDQKLYAFDPDNGTLNYTVECDSYINGRPVLSESKDMIFLGSCDGMIRRINTKTGEITGQIALSSPIPSSPTLQQDMLYAITHNGTLAAINTNTFEIQYQKNNLGNYTSSPYTTEKFIFLTDTNGHINVYSRVDGSFISIIEDQQKMTPLMASNNSHYYAVSIEGKLFAYSKQNDEWEREFIHDFQTDCQHSCSVFEETCLISDTSGGLYFYEVSK
ncbi:MAG: PQQ-binding-like beta-propeller repeat protein [Phycisphaeraceae bacterium JB051]